MISTARFEQAVARVPDPEADRHMAQIGVDAARFGSDAGNVWLYHGRVLTREAELRQVDDFMYAAEMKRAALKAIRAGAKTVSFRVDGTGGYGVYGTIAARGLVAGAAHRSVPPTTAVVPGGDPAGGSRTETHPWRPNP